MDKEVWNHIRFCAPFSSILLPYHDILACADEECLCVNARVAVLLILVFSVCVMCALHVRMCVCVLCVCCGIQLVSDAVCAKHLCDSHRIHLVFPPMRDLLTQNTCVSIGRRLVYLSSDAHVDKHTLSPSMCHKFWLVLT